MLPVRAFGQYGVRIVDAKKFLNRLVGTLPRFDAVTLAEYFRGIFIMRIKTEIATAIVKNGQSVLEISTQLEALSEMLLTSLTPDMATYGIQLSQFTINSISVPDGDPAVQTLKSALAKRAEMSIVGFNYQQERSFDVMQQAAGNEGTGGSIMGAGLGAGVGLGLGVPLGQGMGALAGQMQVGTQAAAPAAPPAPAPPPAPTPPASAAPAPPPSAAAAPMSARDRVQALRDIAELKTQGVLTDAEFEAEKRRILNG
jgi:membrane protease subunit (stomatin/prohibitin family)